MAALSRFFAMATNNSSLPSVYISRRATFCASHRLLNALLSQEENLAIFGKCNNPNGHGHNYVLEVTLYGPVNPDTGFVMNVKDLEQIIEETVLSKLDHKHLNLDVDAFKDLNPTSENIAIIIWNWIAQRIPFELLYEVKLHETENNMVIYRGNHSR